MNTDDLALQLAHPRLFAAIYFGLLSIAGTVLINAYISFLGIEQMIPVSHAIILGIIIAAGTGLVYGESILHCERPYKAKTFWLGFVMVIASLPVFDLGLLLLMKAEYAQLFSIAKFHDLVYFYFIILAYSYILFGVFLAILSGLAAMYLRGQLVYHIVHIQERRKLAKPQPR